MPPLLRPESWIEDSINQFIKKNTPINKANPIVTFFLYHAFLLPLLVLLGSNNKPLSHPFNNDVEETCFPDPWEKRIGRPVPDEFLGEDGLCREGLVDLLRFLSTRAGTPESGGCSSSSSLDVSTFMISKKLEWLSDMLICTVQRYLMDTVCLVIRTRKAESSGGEAALNEFDERNERFQGVRNVVKC